MIQTASGSSLRAYAGSCGHSRCSGIVIPSVAVSFMVIVAELISFQFILFRFVSGLAETSVPAFVRRGGTHWHYAATALWPNH